MQPDCLSNDFRRRVTNPVTTERDNSSLVGLSLSKWNLAAIE